MFGRIDSEPLTTKVYRQIMGMLKSGELDDYTRLPSELDLANKIGVSVSVARDALNIMDAEGYITRKRGIGSIINWEVIRTTCRYDLLNDFQVMIKTAGYRAKTELLSCKTVTLDDGQEYLQILKIIYADDQPAIYIDDRMPVKLIDGEYGEADFKDQSIYDFIQQRNMKIPEIQLVQLNSRVGNDFSKKYLGVGEKESYIEANERSFDINQKLIILSRLLIRDDLVDLTILRKRRPEEG